MKLQFSQSLCSMQCQHEYQSTVKQTSQFLSRFCLSTQTQDALDVAVNIFTNEVHRKKHACFTFCLSPASAASTCEELTSCWCRVVSLAEDLVKPRRVPAANWFVIIRHHADLAQVIAESQSARPCRILLLENRAGLEVARKGGDEAHQPGTALPRQRAAHGAPCIGIRRYELEEEVLVIMDKKISARMACALQEYLSNCTRNLSDSAESSSQRKDYVETHGMWDA